MKTNLLIWIKAARLRTLPLSFSGIIAGSSLAYQNGTFHYDIFGFALLTTLLFQVLSNFANDYGDGVKGTDNEDRIGPKRVLQSGLVSRYTLKKAMLIIAFLSLLSSSILIYIAFDQWIYILIFLVLAFLSVWAAIAYTVGKHSYGYKGLGDVFVFLFFGLLAVLGTVFLYAKKLELDHILVAVIIGCLASAVLNLNNMRDVVNDKLSGKNTLVVSKGLRWATGYHSLLILMPFVAALCYSYLHFSSFYQLLHLLVLVSLFRHLKLVRAVTDPTDFDPELKKVALHSFLWSILFTLSYL